MANGRESVSFFFPAYYDEKTIPKLVREAHAVLGKTGREFEIIVIDDCSPDDTGKMADQLARELPNVRVVHHEKNRGYGGVLTTGFSVASKELVGFTDGDAQFSVASLTRFLEAIGEADLVIGYRVKRAEGFKRKLFSKGYKLLLFLILGMGFKDPDCGFKLIRRKHFAGIRPVSRSGFFSAEMLCRAKRNGLVIREIPVKHLPRRYGTSNCFKWGKILAMFRDLLAMRFGMLG